MALPRRRVTARTPEEAPRPRVSPQPQPRLSRTLTNTGASEASTPARAILVALAVAVTALATYSSAPECGFALDDHLAIVRNADVANMSAPWRDMLAHDFWGRALGDAVSHKSWRPLTTLTFRLNVVASGGVPVASHFHATNVALHALASVLVAHIAWSGSVSYQAPTALLAGLLFAVHPVHVEAVAGIVGRADILGTLFATLAFCAYRCARHAAGVSRAMAWLAVYACLCWCAALSKEVALTVLGICVVHEVAFCAWANPWCPVPASLWPLGPRSPQRPPRGMWMRLLASVVIAVVYLCARSKFTGDRGTLNGSGLLRRAENPFLFIHGTPWLLSVAYLQAYNMGLLLAPLQMCCEYSYNCIPAITTLHDPRNAATLAFGVVVCCGAYFCMRAHREAWVVPGDVRRLSAAYWLVAASWVVLPLLPSSHVFLAVGTLVAERLLYMPSIGVVLLLARMAMSALEAGVATWRRGLALVATLALLTHGILLTRARVRDWHDDLTLYKSAVLVCPGSAKNHHQLGLLYASAGNFSAAMEEYMRARHIDPEFCDVDQSIGQDIVRKCKEEVVTSIGAGVPMQLGDCRQLYEGVVTLRKNMDCVYTNMNSYPLLMQVYQVLLDDNFRNHSLHTEIAEIAEHLNDTEKAAKHHANSGHLLMASRSYFAAERAFAHAVHCQPSRCELYWWLADATHQTDVPKQQKRAQLELAINRVEQSIACVSHARAASPDGRYLANGISGEQGGDSTQAGTELTETRFQPTLLQWYTDVVEHYVQSTTAEDSTALHASNAKLLYNFAKVLNHLDTTLAVQVPNREQLALSYLVQAGLTFTRLKQWDSVARCVEAARHAQGSTSGTDSCSLAVQYINVVGHLTEAATHSLTMRKPLKGLKPSRDGIDAWLRRAAPFLPDATACPDLGPGVHEYLETLAARIENL